MAIEIAFLLSILSLSTALMNELSIVISSKVKHWMSKVDRSLCERLRAFQSPPPMAGMVMVMVMVLLGKPEFAPGIGGAGSSHHTTTRHERKGEGTSLGTGSDEVSRTSSATQVRKRVTAKETPPKSGVQTPMLGMNRNSVCLALRMVVSCRGLFRFGSGTPKEVCRLC